MPHSLPVLLYPSWRFCAGCTLNVFKWIPHQVTLDSICNICSGKLHQQFLPMVYSVGAVDYQWQSRTFGMNLSMYPMLPTQNMRASALNTTTFIDELRLILLEMLVKYSSIIEVKVLHQYQSLNPRVIVTNCLLVLEGVTGGLGALFYLDKLHLVLIRIQYSVY